MAGTPGAFTTDNVPTLLLYNEILDSVERHNEKDISFKDLFCGPTTTKALATIRYRGVSFEKLASDTTKPHMQHLPRREVSLNATQDWGLNESITRKAWDDGMSADEVRVHADEALDADFRIITDCVMHEALTDGGWYDATITPPPFAMNTFAATHDHYLAANVAGVPALSHFTRAKRHITEHGYTDESKLAAFINGTEAEQVENLTEWGTYVGPATSLMDTLQKMGFSPEFRAAGMPVMKTDWMPPYYMLVVSFQEKPMTWRVPMGTGGQNNLDNLRIFTSTSQGETPNLQYQWVQEYLRYTSATITSPGAGVAYYLNGAAWTDSTGWLHS